MTRIGDQTAGGSDTDEYWWCLRHERVERGPGCPAADTMGPFASEAAASRAIADARARTEAWDEADRRWDDDED